MKTITRILVLAALACAATSAFAAGGYLYGLNAFGAMSCNGNKINSFPSDFDSSDPVTTGFQAWRAINIIGENQFVLRADGLFYLNGVKQWKLPYNDDDWYWTCLKHNNDSAYALRQDGGLAVNDTVVQVLPLGDFFFTALEVDGTDTYSLRSDGSVFKNAGSTPVFVFHAGNGLLGFPDGNIPDTLWIALKIKPSTQFIYALRSDGKLFRAPLLISTNTTTEAELPFPTTIPDATNGDLYRDLDFATNGDWLVLRANGMVYREGNSLQPADDFEGNATANNNRFVDLAVYGAHYFALRGDGKVYVGGTTNALLDLPAGDYGVIELSDVPPDLSNGKNIVPYVVQYTIPVNTNLPVRLPVIARDVETPTEDLIVTPVEPMPTGSVWNATARELTLTSAPAVKGNYTFSYIVDDGSGSAKTYKSKIQVKYPDLDPAKNKPPYLPKINKATALTGQEYRIYIPLGDPDNDPVTVTYDPAVFPFSAGATYDSVTSEFIWTPTVLDIAKYTIPFTFSDGTTTKTFKLKLEVKSPLFIDPLPL